MYIDSHMKSTQPPKLVNGPGFYLRVWRAERGLTICAAAKYFGISSSQLSLIERRNRNASPALAAKFAEATGGPIEVFLGVEVTR